jgi:hypothetical protein
MQIALVVNFVILTVAFATQNVHQMQIAHLLAKILVIKQLVIATIVLVKQIMIVE